MAVYNKTMRIIYVTLNNLDEAKKIGTELLKKKLANCVNIFPITCIYNYQGKITDEPETVLLIKTKEDYYEKIEKVIKKNIDYTNFIGQISIEKINSEFSKWLDETVV